MSNPYKALDGASLEPTARKAFTITPSDTETLERVVKRIRAYASAGETLTYHPIANEPGDNVTVTLGEGVNFEEVIADQVLATGTTVIEITGYSD